MSKLSFEEFADAVRVGQPLWVQRRALRAVDDLPLSDAEKVLEVLQATRPTDSSYAALDWAKAMATLTRKAPRAGLRTPGSDEVFTYEERKAILDSFDDKTLVQIAEELLSHDENRWLSMMRPRWGKIVGLVTALEKAPEDSRGSCYEDLSSADVVADLLEESPDVISSAREVLLEHEDATVAALDKKPLATLFKVAKAMELWSPSLFLRLALLAAERPSPSDVESQQIGGLLYQAAQTALNLRGDVEAARKAYALSKKAKRPMTWNDEEIDDDVAELFAEELEEHTDSSREELLASLAKGETTLALRASDFSSPKYCASSSQLSQLMGSKPDGGVPLGKDDGRGLIRDVHGRWWLVEKSGIRKMGVTASAAASAGIQTVSELTRLPSGLVAARADANVLILGPSGVSLITVETPEAWSFIVEGGSPVRDGIELSVIGRGFTAEAKLETDHFTVTRTDESWPPGAHTPQVVRDSLEPLKTLASWIADRVRNRNRLTLRQASQEEVSTLTSWLQCRGPRDWPAVEGTLREMGIDKVAIAVRARAVADEAGAGLDPQWLEEELVALWREVGAIELAIDATTLKVLTPQELAANAPMTTVDAEGSFKPVVVDGKNEPVIVMRADDGTLADDRNRYSLREGKTWKHGWSLEWTLSKVFAHRTVPVLKRLLGASGLEKARVGERVKLKKAKPVARHPDAATAWAALKKWLKKNEVDANLAKSASAKALASFQKKFPGLPPSFIESWAKHNGDDESGIFGGWSMLDLDNIESEYEYWTQEFDGSGDAPSDDPRVEAVWWHERWVPFASSGGGDFLVLDSSEKGQGQVFVALMDPPTRRVVASSFEDWIVRFVHAIESEVVTWSGEWSGLDELVEGVEASG